MPLQGILIGVAAALIVGLLGSALVTYLIYGEKIEMQSMVFPITLIHAVSAFIGTELSKITIEEGSQIKCLLTGIAYTLLLAIFNLFTESGVFSYIWISLIGIGAGSVAGFFVGNATKHKMKFRTKKIKFR